MSQTRNLITTELVKLTRIIELSYMGAS